jgi:hypothetical protein
MTTPAPMYTPGCAAEHLSESGICSVPVWLPYHQPVMPPLDLADGTLVAFAIVGVWVVGLKARLVIRAARMGQF